MQTIGQRLTACDGFGPGFDLVRIVLAFGVVAWHCVSVVYGGNDETATGLIWPFIYAILPMFFALSGFLVTASALRLPLREYILNRSFRIIPALAVDIFFFALVLGPIITTVSLGAYFSDPKFWLYFGNILGWVHYQLPGVFLDNPLSNVVNGALWTVPYEMLCYVVMSLMIWLGWISQWRLVLLSVLVITGTAAALHLLGFQTGVASVDKLVNFMFFTKGASLVPCFLAGSAIYLMRDFVPFDGRIAAAVIAMLVAVGLLAPGNWFGNPLWIAGSVLPFSYLVVWFGLCDLPKLPLFDRGDYSYGVYLYHFPILQLMEKLFGFGQWYTLFLVGSVPITLFAMFSWHRIEKPILMQRKRFSKVGARLAREEAEKTAATAPAVRDGR